MTYRILHIGAGTWSGFAHAPVLQRLAAARYAQISLEGICDLDADKARCFRDEFGYRKAYGSISRAIDEISPDAIYCTVNPLATFGVISELLPRQIPLFIEKPPGISFEQARALAGLAEKHRTLTYVAFNRRCVPSIQRLKQWTAEHTVRFARGEMLRNARLEPNFAVYTGIHALDCIRFLMGNPQHIEVKQRPYGRADAVDSLVQLDFESGAVAEVDLVLNAGLKRESYFLHSDGESAEAVLSAGYSSEFCTAGDWQYSGNSLARFNEANANALISGGFFGEHLAFFEAVRTGREPNCNLQDAALSMQLAEAVQEGFCGEFGGARFL